MGHKSVAFVTFIFFTVLSPISGFAASFRPHLTARKLVSTSKLYAVKDVASEPVFDDAVASAGDALVIVDYSTTWCGPCKVIAPKFEEFSEKVSVLRGGEGIVR